MQRWTERQGDREVGMEKETEETETGREKQKEEKKEEGSQVKDTETARGTDGTSQAWQFTSTIPGPQGANARGWL